MEQAEAAFSHLAIVPSGPDGLPEGLAELAAQRQVDDWSALPHSLLGDVFRHLLEQLVTVEEIVRAWQVLALVCKAWRQALCQSTPLCLELTKPGHLGAAARAWLSSVPMEVVALARTMSPPRGADCQLLAGEGFQAHSASVLRSLMHVAPDAAPLLHRFPRLKQVALYCSDASDPTRPIDAAVFQQLPKLSCLTIAGFWGTLEADQLPTRLKHLAISNYNEGYSLEVALPEGMTQLEMLSLRAEGVVLDWVDACHKCQEVHVAAEALVLRVGAEPIPALIRDVGLNNLQSHMYKRVGAAAAEGARFADACLAFFSVMLASGPLERGVVPVDADEFLQTLRDDLLPAGIDVNPALEVFPDFVRDVPSPEACFVLELVKQEAGQPKSLHFTTPVTDAEVRLLTSQPVWRISWCEDPRAPQILSDPQFIQHSSSTLTDLLSIALVPDLDLRPFTSLLSLLGILRCDDDALGALLRRMPRSLESLCLTAEGAQEPRDFDAALVRHMRKLRELSLYGYRRHDLAALRRGVNVIRILNPVVADGEVIGVGPNYWWPDRTSVGSDNDSDSDSEWEEAEEGEDGAGSEPSADSFDSAMSQPRAGGSGCGSPMAVAVAASAAAGERHAGDADEDGNEQPADAGAQAGEETNGAGAQGASSAAGDNDDGASSSSSESDYVDAEHGGHGGHKHSGGLEDERHSKQACQDAFCPLHSGKSFLQISLTDARQHSAIDFSALLAVGFQMLTVTLSAEHPDARCTLLHEGSWKALLAALRESNVEVLELNCQAAGMTFRSSSLLHRLTEVPVEAAMRYVHEHYGDVWQVKSWNGNTAADGVLEGSRGYALMRRSVLEAHRAAADGFGPPAGAKDL